MWNNFAYSSLPLHNRNLLRRQAVKLINHFVYLSLQRGRVRVRIFLLKGEIWSTSMIKGCCALLKGFWKVSRTIFMAVCLSIKTGFVVFDAKKEGAPLHSGIASSESNAWKLAAHNL